jgi:hypothetical protein
MLGSIMRYGGKVVAAELHRAFCWLLQPLG